jgi:hypothetical protein
MSSLRMPAIIFMLVLCRSSLAQNAAPYDIDALGESLVRIICRELPPFLTENVANLHVEGANDIVEHRSCLIGASTLYKSTNASNPEGLAMRLQIVQPGSGVPRFLEIGTPVAEAVEKIGSPTLQTKNKITYEFGTFENTFVIETRNGVIRSLVWSWFID